MQIIKMLPFLIGVSLAAGCVGPGEKNVPDYSYGLLAPNQLDRWTFDGRIAVKDDRDSWSANVNWRHGPNDDVLKLAGPLGQGAAVIRLTPGQVTIDRGNGNLQASDQPEAFIYEELGVLIPVRALRFWVLGVPKPDQPHNKTIDGFTQAGWLVAYPQMQKMNTGLSLPRKITVTNDQAKLKLIIDQWTIQHAQAN